MWPLTDGPKERRAEKTRRAILQAAADLFGRRAFTDVTMREIAKEAGCSHTAIYIYFKDKEELLNHLASEPLSSAKRRLEAVFRYVERTPRERLFLLSRELIRFCLEHRTLYPVFFTAKPNRVDEKHPALYVQRLRNELFQLVGKAVASALQTELTEERRLACTRSYFYLLHGIIASYVTSEESLEELFERLDETFHLAFRAMFTGLYTLCRSDEKGGGFGED